VRLSSFVERCSVLRQNVDPSELLLNLLDAPCAERVSRAHPRSRHGCPSVFAGRHDRNRDSRRATIESVELLLKYPRQNPCSKFWFSPCVPPWFRRWRKTPVFLSRGPLMGWSLAVPRLARSQPAVEGNGDSHKCARYTLAIAPAASACASPVVSRFSERPARSNACCSVSAGTHRSVRAKHAAIAREGLEPFAAPFAVVEELAGIGRHRLDGLMAALRTS